MQIDDKRGSASSSIVSSVLRQFSHPEKPHQTGSYALDFFVKILCQNHSSIVATVSQQSPVHTHQPVGGWPMPKDRELPARMLLVVLHEPGTLDEHAAVPCRRVEEPGRPSNLPSSQPEGPVQVLPPAGPVQMQGSHPGESHQTHPLLFRQ